MIRNMKVFGLAAVIALAMSAMVATAASANFTAASYPVHLTATSAGDEFEAFGSVVRCTENSFTGNLTGPSNDLLIKPTYHKCTYGTFPATVEMTSCYYTFTTTTASTEPEVGVRCTNAGDEIHIRVYASHAAHTAKTPICHLTVPPQGGLVAGEPKLRGHKYTNVGNDVVISGNVKGIKATQVRTSFVCPAGTSTSAAEYRIQGGGITVQGNGGAVKVDVG